MFFLNGSILNLGWKTKMRYLITSNPVLVIDLVLLLFTPESSRVKWKLLPFPRERPGAAQTGPRIPIFPPTLTLPITAGGGAALAWPAPPCASARAHKVVVHWCSQWDSLIPTLTLLKKELRSRKSGSCYILQTRQTTIKRKIVDLMKNPLFELLNVLSC